METISCIKDSSKPLISVGMPVYNGQKYINEAIDSILCQTFTEFELIISDNASIDSTEQICQEYALKDSRIRYIRQKRNIGAPGNWNAVFSYSQAQYFKWASANDVCHPEKLERCKDILDKYPDVVLCYPRTKLIDENGQLIEECRDLPHASEANPYDRFVGIISVMGLNNAQNGLFRSEVLRKTSLEGIYQGGDIVLMAELALYGKYYEVPHFLFYRRMAPGAATAYRNRKESRRFNDPLSRKKLYLPSLQFNIDLFSAISRSPIMTSEKARLYLFVGKCLYWERKNLWKELLATMRIGTG
jgi:glycosyltransferase involved in cell wall biosynthesis